MVWYGSEPVHSPLLCILPDVLEQPDLMDVLRVSCFIACYLTSNINNNSNNTSNKYIFYGRNVADLLQRHKSRKIFQTVDPL